MGEGRGGGGTALTEARGARGAAAAEAPRSLGEGLDALFEALELGPAEEVLRMLAQGAGPLTARHPVRARPRRGLAAHRQLC